MNALLKILWKSLVRPFYRENAVSFIFFVSIVFFAVGTLNGAGLVKFHYSLIMGMLVNGFVFLLVCFLWLMYVRKCVAFVLAKMKKPEYAFLQLFTRIDKAYCFRLFFATQFLLFLPVWLYASLIFSVALHHHRYAAMVVLPLYLTLICIVPALIYTRRLHYPGAGWPVFSRVKRISISYPLILVRFIGAELKMILGGIKLFTCGILYLIARNNSPADYDLRSPFLFFSFGIFVNGIIIHRIRAFEETNLVFYRSAPISLIKRWLQYALIYLLIFIPELITLALLTPVHLHYLDALALAFCGYFALLLLSSISYVQYFALKAYLIWIAILYAVQYFFLMALPLSLLYLLFLVLSVVIFVSAYFRYEHQEEK
jgi:hypothetical protein